MSVKLYIEGGGDGAHLDALFRRAWTKFFENAGLVGRMPRVVRCGSRTEALRDFASAIEANRTNDFPMLLVDSEESFAQAGSIVEHLRHRDQWQAPAGVSDDQCFLMVQVMETWLLCDVDTLKAYFGQGFRAAAVRAWPDLEQVSKPTVLDALKTATTTCNKRYAKGKVSFELLERITPAKVEGQCPQAKRLLDRLRARPR